MTEIVNVIITDDKSDFRIRTKEALENCHIATIAEAANGRELIDLLSHQTPDVILLDLAMPVMDGNLTLEYLSSNYPEMKVIILSFHDGKILMDEYRQRGAKGFICKDFVTSDMIFFAAGIRKVHKGGTFFHTREEEQTPKFSVRQKEILYLIASKKKPEEIAEALKLTRSGIDKQRNKILKIIGVENHEGLLEYIYKRGLEFLRRPRK